MNPAAGSRRCLYCGSCPALPLLPPTPPPRVPAAAEAAAAVEARLREVERQARRALGEAAAARAACLDERDARAAEASALRAELTTRLTAAEERASAAQEGVAAFQRRLDAENQLIAAVWAEAVGSTEARLTTLERRTRQLVEALAELVERTLAAAGPVGSAAAGPAEAVVVRTRGADWQAEECALPPMPPGRLLWRVSDVARRMGEARGSEEPEPLRSPTFYTGPLGYKLQLELRLDGLGRWRGRHVIASLRRLRADWEPLLAAAPRLRASLVLRDQPDDLTQAQDLVKVLAEGRNKEDPTILHVFIPHNALFQNHYIRDDCLYLDVQVVVLAPESRHEHPSPLLSSLCSNV